MSPEKRRKVERLIAVRVVLDCLRAGYALNVENGGEQRELPRVSKDSQKVLGAMFATDEDTLLVYELRPDPKYHDDRAMDSWVMIGWVRFIYGNSGWDVMADHTESLNTVLKDVGDLAETLSDIVSE